MLLAAGTDFETCVLAVVFFPLAENVFVGSTGCNWLIYSWACFFFTMLILTMPLIQIKTYHFSSIPFALFPPLCFIELFFCEIPFLKVLPPPNVPAPVPLLRRSHINLGWDNDDSSVACPSLFLSTFLSMKDGFNYLWVGHLSSHDSHVEEQVWFVADGNRCSFVIRVHVRTAVK